MRRLAGLEPGAFVLTLILVAGAINALEASAESERPDDRGISFARELSPEEYVWLGRTVWDSMQRMVPADRHRGLVAAEIHALVREMRQNRSEFNIQLEDLLRILGTRAKKRYSIENGEVRSSAVAEHSACEKIGAQPLLGQQIGFDLGRLGIGK